MFDTSVVVQNAPLLFRGLLVTLAFTVTTIVAGLCIGLLVGMAQLSRTRLLRWPARVYVECLRNVPLLVTLLWIYYALPIFAHISVTRMTAGFVALTLYVSSFYAEILRGGVLAVDRGHIDAATALGMSRGHIFFRVVLPQAVSKMLPSLVGQSIIQMKNTTLLSAITVPDLLYQGTYVSSFTYHPVEIYTCIGAIFLAILLPMTMLARRMEQRHG
ncbi:amino acid ABC transporter permease [Gluconacetobacter takamatsuzukensis]|uniref:Amino acid ABC transporter permease n=1 Tax=Gluconacetobacter takamatsuzukensis TaxID=1286190 RepID=A0A7W4KGH7_9PROT|nr:amino acid ABC transporter permease [Gluconacetobacter takamatsuzukensis]MBB2206385.1 amino acid ABC transporter permease [Gluconacetobacter takamatsuzukensis]